MKKGNGVGKVRGGLGTGKGTGKSMRTRLSKLSFSKLPLVPPEVAIRSRSLEIMCFQRYKVHPDRAKRVSLVKSVRPYLRASGSLLGNSLTSNL